MGPAIKGALVTVVVLAVIGLVGIVVFVKTTGLSARATPGSMETAVARGLRALAVPSTYGDLANPVLGNEESIRNGMAHLFVHDLDALFGVAGENA